MRVGKFLKLIDIGSLYGIFYEENEENDDEPLWEGPIYQTPHWISEMKLSENPYKYESAPVEYRHSFGEKYNNKPGVVFIVKE